MRDEYQALSEKTDKTQEEQERLEEITATIKENYPAMAEGIQNATGGFESQTNVLKGLNAEMEQ